MLLIRLFIRAVHIIVLRFDLSNERHSANTRQRLYANFFNPNHTRDCTKSPGIQPTQLVDHSYPTYNKGCVCSLAFFLLPSRGEGDKKEGSGISRAPLGRLCLNNPPTAVGGIAKGSSIKKSRLGAVLAVDFFEKRFGTKPFRRNSQL